MNNKNWWCPQCNCEVAPENVTFTELHDERNGGCGNPVLERKPIKTMRLKQLAEKVKAVYGKCYVSIQGEITCPTNSEPEVGYSLYIVFRGAGADTSKPAISETFTSLTDLEDFVNRLVSAPNIDTDINPQVFESKNEDLLHEIQEQEHEEMKENPEEFNYNLK